MHLSSKPKSRRRWSKPLTAAFLTSALLVLSKTNADRFCSQKPFRHQLHTWGTQNSVVRDVSLTKDLFRLLPNPSAVLEVRSWIINSWWWERLSSWSLWKSFAAVWYTFIFPLAEVKALTANMVMGALHSPFHCTTRFGQVLFMGWLATEAQ